MTDSSIFTNGDDTTGPYLAYRKRALREGQTDVTIRRVFSAMGQGAQAGWGDQPLDLSPETVNWLRQHGVFENGGSGLYHDMTALLRTFNESVLRGGAAALDLLLNRGPQAALHSLTYGFGQASDELGLIDHTGVPPEVVQRKRENGQTASEIGSELADNLNLMALLSGADFGFMGAPGAAISVPEEISAAKASGAAAEIDSAIRGLGEPNGPLIVRLENDLGAQLPAVSPEPPPNARLILDAGPPFHLIKQGREGLVRSAEMRKRWETLWGRDWPIDPDTGKPQIVHHIRPVGDGGLDHETNIEPMTEADHIQHHGENGDSVRWGRRRWQNLQNSYGQNWQPGDKD